jgi:hypothetical protein
MAVVLQGGFPVWCYRKALGKVVAYDSCSGEACHVISGGDATALLWDWELHLHMESCG